MTLGQNSVLGLGTSSTDYFSSINIQDIWALLLENVKCNLKVKTLATFTCQNTIGTKTHNTYIDTFETACLNVDATAPLLDTDLAIKGILEHTLVQLTLKYQVGTNWFQVARGLILFKQPSQSILLSQLQLPRLSRINQHKSTFF